MPRRPRDFALELLQCGAHGLALLGGVLEGLFQTGHHGAGIQAVLVEIRQEAHGLLNAEAHLLERRGIGQQIRGELSHVRAGILRRLVQQIQHRARAVRADAKRRHGRLRVVDGAVEVGIIELGEPYETPGQILQIFAHEAEPRVDLAHRRARGPEIRGDGCGEVLGALLHVREGVTGRAGLLRDDVQTFIHFVEGRHGRGSHAHDGRGDGLRHRRADGPHLVRKRLQLLARRGDLLFGHAAEILHFVGQRFQIILGLDDLPLEGVELLRGDRMAELIVHRGGLLPEGLQLVLGFIDALLDGVVLVLRNLARRELFLRVLGLLFELAQLFFGFVDLRLDGIVGGLPVVVFLDRLRGLDVRRLEGVQLFLRALHGVAQQLLLLGKQLRVARVQLQQLVDVF